ncbi:MAG: glycosyltransferase family 2 protein [Candidatus Heimdallarchaeota archaeon]|nr:glycosyltransferase family 2 protein [Candidatus Heimdallarchaeota archaeon]
MQATLDSLLNQTLKPSKIIIIDDGSTDKTAKIAQKYSDDKVHVIIRKERIGGPSLLGTPMMAIPFNIGFKFIEEQKIDYDFMMISGADCVYQIDYIEKLSKRLEAEKNLVVVSGHQYGESINRDHTRGAGRIIKKDFWQYYGGKYPYPSYLWESGINFKAQMLGLRVRSYTDCYYTSQRTSGTNIDMTNYGKMLRAIGYPFLIALGRALRTAKRNGIKSAIRLISGYLLTPQYSFKADQEIREYLSKNFISNKIRYYINKSYR